MQVLAREAAAKARMYEQAALRMMYRCGCPEHWRVHTHAMVANDGSSARRCAAGNRCEALVRLLHGLMHEGERR